MNIITAGKLLVRHPYLQYLRIKESELSVFKSLWLRKDCPILSMQLDKCPYVHMHLSPSHQFQSQRLSKLGYLILKYRTLILFTAFSSVYSYHIKWLTMLLLSYPQRPVDILHKHHSQSWGSQAMLWLVQNRDLFCYSSQSERTSLSIHKPLHHKVSPVIKEFSLAWGNQGTAKGSKK